MEGIDPVLSCSSSGSEDLDIPIFPVLLLCRPLEARIAAEGTAVCVGPAVPAVLVTLVLLDAWTEDGLLVGCVDDGLLVG